MFGNKIDSLDNSKITLRDIVKVIDNRGKTPPLSNQVTNYPIIDVRSLSGNSRVINYNNCSKYVKKEIYDNWFRNGHPKYYDILISTVGSLAEIKLFIDNVGCISQNVVALRCTNISPLYLYQYLKYIKYDLIAYNIGSVQPSIKVTHIMKHNMYIAPNSEIKKFDKISDKFTKKIAFNYSKNENLKKLRDILINKLISGEINLSNVNN